MPESIPVEDEVAAVVAPPPPAAPAPVPLN